MESLTKNKQSDETIKNMIHKAFPKLKMIEVSELTEGYFNAAYCIELSNGQSVILKISPKQNSLIMSYEKNIMYSEVSAMKLVAEKTSVPVPKILFYDNTRSICDSEYFFMSKLPGKSLNILSDSLTEDMKNHIQYQSGKYTSEINSITGEKFGYFGQPDKQGSDWYSVFQSMIKGGIEDAKAMNIDITVNPENIYELLEKDKSVFEEVNIPRLIHWDLWAGNIFIENNEISGIIDFERCLWGDNLMEVGFRTYQCNQNFMNGYGIKSLSENQKRRSKWYDAYLFLLMSLEYDYRKYETKDIYEWSTKKLREWIKNF